jgi:hypothetical protein
MIDIVFSFDTTGSMASVIESVRRNLVATIDRLFADIPDIRIGIIVHGDYCDMPRHLFTLDLCDDASRIKSFVIDAPDTSGGDYPECYEIVLYTARTKMNWREHDKLVKVLVVIGDAIPHDQGEVVHIHSSDPSWDAGDVDTAILRVQEQIGLPPCYKVALDWKEEVAQLHSNRVLVMSCHALPDENEQAVSFYTHIAEATNGLYLPLYDLSLFKDYMVGICMKVADSAEDVELLQRQLQELHQQSLTEQNEEKRKQLLAEKQEVQTAISSASRESMFSPSFVKTAEKVRKSRGLSSRTEMYEEELHTKTPETYLSDARNNDFFNVLRSREGFETPSKAARSAMKSVKSAPPTSFAPVASLAPPKLPPMTPKKRVLTAPPPSSAVVLPLRVLPKFELPEVDEIEEEIQIVDEVQTPTKSDSPRHLLTLNPTSKKRYNLRLSRRK